MPIGIEIADAIHRRIHCARTFGKSLFTDCTYSDGLAVSFDGRNALGVLIGHVHRAHIAPPDDLPRDIEIGIGQCGIEGDHDPIFRRLCCWPLSLIAPGYAPQRTQTTLADCLLLDVAALTIYRPGVVVGPMARPRWFRRAVIGASPNIPR